MSAHNRAKFKATIEKDKAKNKAKAKKKADAKKKQAPRMRKGK